MSKLETPLTRAYCEVSVTVSCTKNCESCTNVPAFAPTATSKAS